MADSSHVSGLRAGVRAPFDAVARNRRIVGAALMALMLVACSRGAAPAQKPSDSAARQHQDGRNTHVRSALRSHELGHLGRAAHD